MYHCEYNRFFCVPIQTMVNTLLEYDNDCHVYVVDWGRGAEPPYTQAVVNIELLGAYVGHLMTLIEVIL